jgi:hypothetical protein
MSHTYTEITDINTTFQHDESLAVSGIFAPDLWLMADFSPVLLSAENLSTEIEVEGVSHDDWGYLVKFTFSQVVRNATDYPSNFILEDDDGTIWYGQEAYIDNNNSGCLCYD